MSPFASKKEQKVEQKIKNEYASWQASQFKKWQHLFVKPY